MTYRMATVSASLLLASGLVAGCGSDHPTGAQQASSAGASPSTQTFNFDDTPDPLHQIMNTDECTKAMSQNGPNALDPSLCLKPYIGSTWTIHSTVLAVIPYPKGVPNDGGIGITVKKESLPNGALTFDCPAKIQACTTLKVGDSIYAVTQLVPHEISPTFRAVEVTKLS